MIPIRGCDGIRGFVISLFTAISDQPFDLQSELPRQTILLKIVLIIH